MDHTKFKAHGFITLSNCGGIEVMLNRSCDGLWYRFNYGQDMSQEEIFEAEILYGYDEDNDDPNNTESLPYFLHVDSKYFLKDCIKVQPICTDR